MKVKFIIKEQVEEAPMSTEEAKQEIQAKINNIDAVLLPQILNFINSLESGAAQPTEFAAVTEKKKMTKSDEKKREKYVKGMKSSKKNFEKRYGKDAEDVMYATATKMAMKKKKK